MDLLDDSSGVNTSTNADGSTTHNHDQDTHKGAKTSKVWHKYTVAVELT